MLYIWSSLKANDLTCKHKIWKSSQLPQIQFEKFTIATDPILSFLQVPDFYIVICQGMNVLHYAAAAGNTSAIEHILQFGGSELFYSRYAAAAGDTCTIVHILQFGGSKLFYSRYTAAGDTSAIENITAAAL